ncbi:hypothetical protein HDU88_001129 [Geranomyces variabilis]|nr:hypothetical protein HDU88_001129 [Geranomyces variabilis]
MSANRGNSSTRPSSHWPPPAAAPPASSYAHSAASSPSPFHSFPVRESFSYSFRDSYEGSTASSPLEALPSPVISAPPSDGLSEPLSAGLSQPPSGFYNIDRESHNEYMTLINENKHIARQLSVAAATPNTARSARPGAAVSAFLHQRSKSDDVISRASSSGPPVGIGHVRSYDKLRSDQQPQQSASASASALPMQRPLLHNRTQSYDQPPPQSPKDSVRHQPSTYIPSYYELPSPNYVALKTPDYFTPHYVDTFPPRSASSSFEEQGSAPNWVHQEPPPPRLNIFTGQPEVPYTTTTTAAPEEPMPLFSGYLYKLGSNKRFQWRLLRFDGQLLTCLSNTKIKVPASTAAATPVSPTYVNVPNGQPMPLLNNAILADTSKSEDPDFHWVHIPKWTIHIGSVTSISLIKRVGSDDAAEVPQMSDVPKWYGTTKIFVIRTADAKNYVLRAKTRDDLERWLFVLTSMWRVKKQSDGQMRSQHTRQQSAESASSGPDIWADTMGRIRRHVSFVAPPQELPLRNAVDNGGKNNAKASALSYSEDVSSSPRQQQQQQRSPTQARRRRETARSSVSRSSPKPETTRAVAKRRESQSSVRSTDADAGALDPTAQLAMNAADSQDYLPDSDLQSADFMRMSIEMPPPSPQAPGPATLVRTNILQQLDDLAKDLRAAQKMQKDVKRLGIHTQAILPWYPQRTDSLEKGDERSTPLAARFNNLGAVNGSPVTAKRISAMLALGYPPHPEQPAANPRRTSSLVNLESTLAQDQSRRYPLPPDMALPSTPTLATPPDRAQATRKSSRKSIKIAQSTPTITWTQERNQRHEGQQPQIRDAWRNSLASLIERDAGVRLSVLVAAGARRDDSKVSGGAEERAPTENDETDN